MDEILLKPVAKVISKVDEPSNMPLGGVTAVIEILPEYTDALKGIGENSHIWIIAWFHKAPRNILRTRPGKVNPDLPEYGVFALRSFARPNPVALSLVKLVKVEYNRLYVEGLDAIDGTPIIDIKPYFENDIIFSPVTPHICGKKRDMRQGRFLKQALTHHQERCTDLLIGVRMAVIAEEIFGHLNSQDLLVEVSGSGCLVDTIQGLSRARVANPARLLYSPSENLVATVWSKDNKVLRLTIKQEYTEDNIFTLEDDELFEIALYKG
ncbi:MAG: tRNA (N6-threonylcarbamoyladenosine(37)-N6)-methyltransferase TrmO [Syntrophomonadaceae bacterium]|nr:tRNA (N6-threonylcarbamoyladenosine(37)-N6)-methyltransferase TrmO [Syntrophomonadaceae bacterium]MDD3889803.1 tRNA (N6-threonylcarbamoyladenosine(37)-N6)-methyltransferase TrmO [Syntrophomonadaceae bacterium]MDD4549562.1 tRNA (N6-threonylcarbamoyladenosine(37)-N6)-methyltransferase TrmO [Syntrophomonadaceae bacterium]